ncbi:MAG: polyprenyl synthetase family protein, partial [Massilia sp.]
MTTATPRYDGLRLKKFDDAVFDDIDTLRSAIDDRIEQLLSANGQSDSLAKAMRTSALSAGKRMRPLLVMLVARDLGCASPALIDVACSVELVHA